MKTRLIFTLLILSWISTSSLLAQRNLRDIPPPNVEAEIKAMKVDPDFQVNLFAADPMVVNPIQMNFDPEGRLWIASSPIYPHILPGQEANDKIYVLDDRDGDGVAEKSTVFAEGLLIPTGVLPGDDGVYVANSTELIHFKDTDGDDKADQRRVVLSGFGTEDTHHIIHCFRWGVDGSFYFNQSIYIHSHVETPHGVRRLRAGGIWRFRPRSLELEVFVHGMVNGWGHHWDKWGQSFGTDGAYGQGTLYFMPGVKYVAALGARRLFTGLNRGTPKYCGAAIASGKHLPEDWRGDMITCDFRAQRVVRYSISEDKAGYSAKLEPTVIKSSHVAFRPVDVKMGPDGAIYLCDWYNPIIQHGEVDFRDERRNHTNGRIWRLSYKGNKALPNPKLKEKSIPELLDQLKAEEGWTRDNAKRLLHEKPASQVIPHLKTWLTKLDPQDSEYERMKLEGLWVAKGVDHHDFNLLKDLLNAKQGQARAAATRVLSHWGPYIYKVNELYEKVINDPFPRVRLEAVRGLSRIKQPWAADLAMKVMDHPMDKFIEYSLWRTVNDLKDVWVPNLQKGKIPFGGDTRKLDYALSAVGSNEVLGAIKNLAKDPNTSPANLKNQLLLITKIGKPDDLKFVAQRLKGANEDVQSSVIKELVSTSRSKKIVLGDQSSFVKEAINSKSASIKADAIRLVGLWKLNDIAPLLHKEEQTKDLSIVQAVFQSFARLGGERATYLEQVSSTSESTALRILATQAIASDGDINKSAQLATQLLTQELSEKDAESLLRAFISRQNGAESLAKALGETRLSTEVSLVGIQTLNKMAIKNSPLEPMFKKGMEERTSWGELKPAQVQKLLADVIKDGDPSRGEEIYHREKLACTTCHAIGGAGGVVGPDFSSIGASAPLDYLVESILFPQKKVKENYHSVQVITQAGQIITGIPVRDGDAEVVLRDADGKEHTIVASTILNRTTGGSIMPDGLIDELNRQELLDLISFTSKLGKTKAFSVGREKLIRRWRSFQALGNPKPNDDTIWKSVYSRVSGVLPFDTKKGSIVHLRGQIEVTTAGQVGLKFNSTAGLSVMVQGVQPQFQNHVTVVNLKPGINTLELTINLESRKGEGLKCELFEIPDSKASFQAVGGP